MSPLLGPENSEELLSQSLIAMVFRHDPLNIYIGEKILTRRHELGLTKENLAHQCNITVARLEMYESGEIRVAAHHLLDMAEALDMKLVLFFPTVPLGAKGTKEE